MNYNLEFEKIDSENKAYVLGLLYADGCITNLNTIRISLIDKQLILDVQKEFKFFNLGSFDYSIYNITGQQVLAGKGVDQQRVDISFLKIGLYFIRTESGDVIRFIKE